MRNEIEDIIKKYFKEKGYDVREVTIADGLIEEKSIDTVCALQIRIQKHAK